MAKLSPSLDRGKALRRLLDGLLVAAATLTLAAIALGPIGVALPGTRLRASMSSVWRPALVLAIVAAAWWYARRSSDRVQVLARLGITALLATWVLSCVYFGDRACGGLDSYGYVGASQLLASGRLQEDQPIARLLPFPEAPHAAAPVGFVVGRDGHSSVPRFPLGLPLVMAIFRLLGPGGPFWVPLVMAVGTLVLSYRLGRIDNDADGLSGLFAASVVAASPTFFNGAIQPMSDVPATFWVLAAVWFSLARSCRPVGAGLAAGMAVLTRPVLLPAALMIMGLLAWRCRDTWLPRSNRDARRAVSTAGSAAVSCASRTSLVAGLAAFGALILAQAALNVVLYGGVAASGYGTLAYLLNPARITANVKVYAHWITSTHTVAFWALWGAAVVALRGRRWAAWFTLVSAAAMTPYLLYLTFDDWETTRFVLPGLALALIVGARGVDVMLARYFRRWRPALLFFLALACAMGSYRFLSAHHVFELWRLESKYPRVGQWVRDETPPAAVVISVLHSGSIRYYAGRDTVRWDMIPARMLSSSVAALASHGRAVYLALDAPSEAGPFAERFRDDLTDLSMIPVARVDAVFLYELRRRRASPAR